MTSLIAAKGDVSDGSQEEGKCRHAAAQAHHGERGRIIIIGDYQSVFEGQSNSALCSVVCAHGETRKSILIGLFNSDSY